MFRIGELIVCINDSSAFYGIEGYEIKQYLTKYKYYIIIDLDENDGRVGIVNDKGNLAHYNISRFISIIEFRKRKLNKICSNKEI